MKTWRGLTNGNIQEWGKLYVEELSLAPDGASLALVFSAKPFVVQLAAP